MSGNELPSWRKGLVGLSHSERLGILGKPDMPGRRGSPPIPLGLIGRSRWEGLSNVSGSWAARRLMPPEISSRLPSHRAQAKWAPEFLRAARLRGGFKAERPVELSAAILMATSISSEVGPAAADDALVPITLPA